MAGNTTGKKPKGASIVIKDSNGTNYWFDPTTKVVYEEKVTATYAGVHVNYYPVTGQLEQDLLSANWSKVGSYFTQPIGAYNDQTATVNTSQSLRYPQDMKLEGNTSDYVLFQFYDYNPPFGPNSQGNPNATNPVSINLNLNEYNSSVNDASPAEGFKQILLYMPDDIQDAYRGNWEGKKFGSITAGVLSSAGKNGTIQKLQSLTKTAKDTASRLGVNAAATAVSELAKGITGDNISSGDVFASVGGVIRNPNVELLFQSMSLRTFDLTFRMSPYYQEETKIIEDIIKEFKRAMLPSYGAGPEGVFGIKNSAIGSSFIKVPKLCLVQYMRGSDPHPHLPQYKLCAITDMNVNFTPDNNYSTFSGGGPVSYELKLNFMETKLVFSEDWTASVV